MDRRRPRVSKKSRGRRACFPRFSPFVIPPLPFSFFCPCNSVWAGYNRGYYDHQICNTPRLEMARAVGPPRNAPLAGKTPTVATAWAARPAARVHAGRIAGRGGDRRHAGGDPLPAVNGVRAVAQRTACLNNLREIGLSTQVYVNAHDSYPPAWTSSTCRWMDLLKPYIDKQCNVYRCPSDPKQIACTYDPSITLSYGINVFNFVDDAHCFWYEVWSWDVKNPRPGDLVCRLHAGPLLVRRRKHVLRPGVRRRLSAHRRDLQRRLLRRSCGVQNCDDPERLECGEMRRHGDATVKRKDRLIVGVAPAVAVAAGVVALAALRWPSPGRHPRQARPRGRRHERAASVHIPSRPTRILSLCTSATDTIVALHGRRLPRGRGRVQPRCAGD